MLRPALPRLAAILSITLASPSWAQRPDPLAGFDAYVDQAVRDWRVPGLAIAVVQGDSVTFAKGYGVRMLGRPEPVGIHTLFANASTTKAFTSMVVATLVNEGKMRWDDPAARWLPTFALFDPYASRELTVRDLLSHRVGFADPSFWYGTGLSWDDIVSRTRRVEPQTSFRSRYAYNNVTYAAAGQAAAAAAGASWADLVRRRILEPLGMRETVMSTEEAAARADVATPHFRISDTVRVIDRYPTDNIGPAGAMYSSVSDMTRWLRFVLDSTRLAAGREPTLLGTPIVAPRTFAEMFTPQTVIRQADFYPTARLTHPYFTAYGLGWFLEDYRGEFVAMHTGSIDGFVAIVGLIPARRVGVVVFANVDHTEVRHALMYTVFDRYLDAAGDAKPSARHDWSREMRTMYDSMRTAGEAAQKRIEATRVANTKPTLPLERYVGVYSDSLAGTVRVTLEKGQLVWTQSPMLTADLDHWHYDTFRARWRSRWLGTDLVTFRLGEDGTVRGVELGGTELRRQR